MHYDIRRLCGTPVRTVGQTSCCSNLHSGPHRAGHLKSTVLWQALGDARVVVLSEAFHNCKEFIYLHHRVIGSLLRRWASKEVRRCAGCKGDGSEALLCKLCPDRGPTIAVAVALVLGQLALALRSSKHTAADGAQPESTPKELQSSSKSLTEIRCQLPGVSHVGQENNDTWFAERAAELALSLSKGASTTHRPFDTPTDCVLFAIAEWH